MIFAIAGIPFGVFVMLGIWISCVLMVGLLFVVWSYYESLKVKVTVLEDEEKVTMANTTPPVMIMTPRKSPRVVQRVTTELSPLHMPNRSISMTSEVTMMTSTSTPTLEVYDPLSRHVGGPALAIPGSPEYLEPEGALPFAPLKKHE